MKSRLNYSRNYCLALASYNDVVSINIHLVVLREGRMYECIQDEVIHVSLCITRLDT